MSGKLPETLDKWLRSDMDRLAVEQGCWFDLPAAERVRDFFSKFLRHSKGEWAGQRFDLLPWQWDDVLCPIFGWKRADGTRRYRKGYIEVAKKNGKSTFCAGLSLYLLVGDDEPGAEVYSAGADREQASIIFREAASMVRASPELSDHIQVVPSTKRLVFPRAQSWYHALSADAYRQEGLNAHAVIFEELHAQKTRDLWDTLAYAGASRRQPLLIAITTAGWNRESICWEQRQYAQRVIDNLIEDTSFFAYIRAADEKDDWTDPEVWRKANPSFGITVKEAEFTEACKEAQAEPRKENTFKRYRLNVWTEQAIRWISMAKWEACGGEVDRKALRGRKCFAAFDLSAAKDLTALVLVFPPDDAEEPWKVLPSFWIPRDRAVEKERKDKVPYLTWERQGFITLIPGEVIDYGWIERAILDLGKEFQVPEVAFDPWNASQTANNLMDAGVELIQFRQGYKSMNEPSKEFERLMIAGKLAHGGHPVLRWNAANVCVVEDDAGNIKPSKKHSPERIDGIVASIMGLGRAMLAEKESVYETRGILTL